MLNGSFDRRHAGQPAQPAPHTALHAAARTVFLASSEPCRLRVLVVDDDPSDIALVDRALRRMVRYEVEVVSAGSLAAALWVLSAEPQDLVLIDYSLREECGTDLVRWVAARGLMTPVIMLTSLWTAEVDAEALEAGGVACLSKDDLTPRIMETTVRQALRGQALEKTLNHLAAAPATAPATGGAMQSRPSAQIERRFDIQSLAVDAVSSWHGLGNSVTAVPVKVRLKLMDRPIYVNASELEFRSAFDWLSAALPVHAACGSVIHLTAHEHEGLGELVIEASTPARGGGPLCGTSCKTLSARRSATASEMRSQVSIGSRGGHVIEWVSPDNSGRRTSVALPLAGSTQRRA